MKPKTNTILIIICTLVVAAGAYWYFFTDSLADEPSFSATTTSSATQARFQSLLSELQPISFDTRIFDDSRFMALVDLTTPLTSETSGRADPFAPVSGVGSSDSASTP